MVANASRGAIFLRGNRALPATTMARAEVLD